MRERAGAMRKCFLGRGIALAARQAALGMEVAAAISQV